MLRLETEGGPAFGALARRAPREPLGRGQKDGKVGRIGDRPRPRRTEPETRARARREGAARAHVP